jgi:hypothetical protein
LGVIGDAIGHTLIVGEVALQRGAGNWNEIPIVYSKVQKD